MSSTSTTGTVITAEVLLRAYASGIFPMAESADDPNLFWVDPEARGVLPLQGFHVPRRLARTVRSDRFSIRTDSAFLQVVDRCAAATPDRPSTWINQRIRGLYDELFRRGHGHSVEAWAGDELVGGLYGVRLAGVFFGESMFSTERDASKVALVHLAARLKAGGFALLDTQFITDHLKQFGARQISRNQYHRLLDEALRVQGDFFALPGSDVAGAEALQVLSQTS